MTLSIDDLLVERAREVARQQGLDELIRNYHQTVAGKRSREDVVRELCGTAILDTQTHLLTAQTPMKEGCECGFSGYNGSAIRKLPNVGFGRPQRGPEDRRNRDLQSILSRT